jgi:hypothetical protein
LCRETGAQIIEAKRRQKLPYTQHESLRKVWGEFAKNHTCCGGNVRNKGTEDYSLKPASIYSSNANLSARTRIEASKRMSEESRPAFNSKSKDYGLMFARKTRDAVQANNN